MTFNPLKRVLENREVILAQLKGLTTLIGNFMSTTALQFSDVTTALTALTNDNTASNNAVLGQLAELKQLLIDFAAATQAGTPPTQAQFQAAIAQITEVDSIMKTNTAAVQASATAITAADPAAAPPAPPPPGSTTTTETGTAKT